MGPPPLQLPQRLRAKLAAHGQAAVTRVEAALSTAPRRCVYVESERVSDTPLRRGPLGRLFGLGVAQPVLGPLASKLGGVPYDEGDAQWDAWQFLGQINFADVGDPPEGCPKRGILAIDLSTDPRHGGLRTRWYPRPSEKRAVRNEPVAGAAWWEARLQFRPGWSLRDDPRWLDLVPRDDEKLAKAWEEWSPDGYDEDADDDCHRILGHRPKVLEENYGFEPAPGRTESIDEYEMLLRITFDKAADLGWGSNRIYVIIHRDDLARGDLQHARITGANE